MTAAALHVPTGNLRVRFRIEQTAAGSWTVTRCRRVDGRWLMDLSTAIGYATYEAARAGAARMAESEGGER